MSVNEWAEVLNYHRERDEEKIKKEKEAAELKKQLNRLSLDKQLREKRERMFKEKEAQKQIELMLLQHSKARLEQEDAHK